MHSKEEEYRHISDRTCKVTVLVDSLILDVSPPY